MTLYSWFIAVVSHEMFAFDMLWLTGKTYRNKIHIGHCTDKEYFVRNTRFYMSAIQNVCLEDLMCPSLETDPIWVLRYIYIYDYGRKALVRYELFPLKYVCERQLKDSEHA